MSVLGIVSEVVGVIKRLQSAIQDEKYPRISEFFHDARRFILKNRQIVDTAPLQVYCTGLIFAPKDSTIRRIFNKEGPTWLRQLPKVEESWSAELQTLEGHSDWVTSVAFSPNGQLLASGSDDKTIKLWDPTTGELRQTLKGHNGCVQSVTFSPNSRLLASSSDDRTIKLWDPITDELCQTLKGHNGRAQSVAFSPNGQLLASSSIDKTIKLWDRS
ncbi:hypothetical protein GJ744_005417 [Endocarpon pusillum]|uniref:Mitochondrial division protein 1 n=1 Tax=Endocarpon pusillum TaxID=364733 RepID=A0A8H7A8K9_9EURO|nr:hypothetical protein GJ744_005417 [Endocarpon pusillum]